MGYKAVDTKGIRLALGDAMPPLYIWQCGDLLNDFPLCGVYGGFAFIQRFSGCWMGEN